MSSERPQEALTKFHKLEVMSRGGYVKREGEDSTGIGVKYSERLLVSEGATMPAFNEWLMTKSPTQESNGPVTKSASD